MPARTRTFKLTSMSTRTAAHTWFETRRLTLMDLTHAKLPGRINLWMPRTFPAAMKGLPDELKWRMYGKAWLAWGECPHLAVGVQAVEQLGDLGEERVVRTVEPPGTERRHRAAGFETTQASFGRSRMRKRGGPWRVYETRGSGLLTSLTMPDVRVPWLLESLTADVALHLHVSQQGCRGGARGGRSSRRRRHGGRRGLLRLVAGPLLAWRHGRPRSTCAKGPREAFQSRYGGRSV